MELGFDAVSRGAGVADVAPALECAEPTVSTLLREAEARVMRRLVGRDGRRAGD